MLRLTHEDNEVIEQPPSFLCPTQMMQHTPGEHNYFRLCTSDLVNVARSVHTITCVQDTDRKAWAVTELMSAVKNLKKNKKNG